MFDIGFAELMVVGVLGLIILGPERLPKAAHAIGILVGKVRRTMSGIQQEIEREVHDQELRDMLDDPMHSYLSDDELSPEQKAEKERLAKEAADKHLQDKLAPIEEQRSDISSTPSNSIDPQKTENTSKP